jgi:hypothetical protein
MEVLKAEIKDWEESAEATLLLKMSALRAVLEEIEPLPGKTAKQQALIHHIKEALKVRAMSK